MTPGLVGDPDAPRGARASSRWPRSWPGPRARPGGARRLDRRAARDAAAARPAAARCPRRSATSCGAIAPRELLLPRGAGARARRSRARCPAPCAARSMPRELRAAQRAAHPDGLRRGPRRRGVARGGRAARATSATPALRARAGRARCAATRSRDAMVLDAATRAHLELFRNGEDGSRARTLIERIDVTRTPLGARRLARWLAYPLLDPGGDRARARTPSPGWPSATACARGCARRCARCATSSACSPRPRARPRRRAIWRSCARRSRRCPASVAALAAPDDERLADARAAARRSCRCRRRCPSWRSCCARRWCDEPPATAARLARRARDRLHPRGLPRRARRAARGGAQGPRVDRGARGERARAHRHRER